MPVCLAVVDGARCGAVFQTKAELTTHVVDTHSHVMCDFVDCCQHYGDLRTLRDHVDRIHERIHHLCNVCEVEFSTRNQFYTHRKKVAACAAATKTLVQHEAPAPREYRVAVQTGEHYSDLTRIPVVATVGHRGAVLVSAPVDKRRRMVTATVTSGAQSSGSTRVRQVGASHVSVPVLRRRVPVLAVETVVQSQLVGDGSTDFVEDTGGFEGANSIRSVVSSDSIAVTSTVDTSVTPVASTDTAMSTLNPDGSVLVVIPGTNDAEIVDVSSLVEDLALNEANVVEFQLAAGEFEGLVGGVRDHVAKEEAHVLEDMDVLVDETPIVDNVVKDDSEAEDMALDGSYLC